jgi:UDP-N-acetylmuramoyl-L-alanyl-D-glutamate--2,6-diaminopimelate ligase
MSPIDISTWIHAAAPGGRLVSDSRRVQAGDVFFAYPGDAQDGRRYIAAAVDAGAAAIVFDGQDFVWDETIVTPHLAVAGLKGIAGPIAHAVLGQPDSGMFTVAVTGTNGKTSCALWTAQALARLGETAGVIGTLGVGVIQPKAKTEAQFDVTGYTTPDAVLLAQTLAELKDKGVTSLAIEASSIGLVQERTAGMHVDVAIFTNLTRDHLDFHGDMASYEAAKVKLFEWPGLKHAVVNLDDAAGQRLVAHLRANFPALAVTGYTLDAASNVPEGVAVLRASGMRSKNAGTECQVETPLGNATIRSRLVGNYNVSNTLAVLGALIARGVALKSAVEAIESLVPAPGRMQQMGGQDAPMVVIDYAHTPDALEKTLEALRQVATDRGGQLWCVFGCGGDRDPGKRPQMGRIAQSADQVLVTSDNPRSEEPGSIIAQIVAGMDANDPASRLQTVEDRASAILLAVKQAAKQDVILLAGKGHEPYQEIKGRKMPFSDTDHASLALTARLTMLRTH